MGSGLMVGGSLDGQGWRFLIHRFPLAALLPAASSPQRRRVNRAAQSTAAPLRVICASATNGVLKMRFPWAGNGSYVQLFLRSGTISLCLHQQTVK